VRRRPQEGEDRPRPQAAVRDRDPRSGFVRQAGRRSALGAEVTGRDEELETAIARVRACGDEASLREVERELLGKSGPVGALFASIGTLPPRERKEAGARAN